MQAQDDDAKFEDDGYDYIGQLDIIQHNVHDVKMGEDSLSTNPSQDLNAIKVSQNPYYEESLDPKNHAGPNSMARVAATTLDHITKLENPYYEGM